MNRFIRSERLKKAGIFFLHSTKKRYIGIFLDPVLACNLRCRMCYFSDEEKRKQFKGKLTAEELTKIADAFYHRALKLQIGCGAEPTLYPHNADIIRQAKEKNVPYISMTTNGNLLDEDTTEDFIVAGLNEITLSLHGVNKESYEYFMPGASYETFHKLMTGLTKCYKIFIIIIPKRNMLLFPQPFTNVVLFVMYMQIFCLSANNALMIISLQNYFSFFNPSSVK